MRRRRATCRWPSRAAAAGASATASRACSPGRHIGGSGASWPAYLSRCSISACRASACTYSPRSRNRPAHMGGLANAIVGSLVQTGLGTLIGTPIGLMVGTYLAEYAGRSALGNAVRFVSDILLSAPSILIGLFIYQILVAPFGGFSGIAGAARAGDHRDSHRGAHHRGHAPPDTDQPARGLDRAWCATVEDHRFHLLPCGVGRAADRRAAGGRAGGRARRRLCCSPRSAIRVIPASDRPWPACPSRSTNMRRRRSTTGCSSPGRARCLLRLVCSLSILRRGFVVRGR